MPINPAHALRVFMTQQARKEVQEHVRQAGIKVNRMTVLELNRLVEAHLKANAPNLLKTVEMRYAPLLAQWRVQWQRYQDRRSQRVCKSPK